MRRVWLVSDRFIMGVVFRDWVVDRRLDVMVGDVLRVRSRD